MTVVNSQGMVLDVVQCNQLEPGESQDLCGNYGTALLAYSGQPTKGARGTAEDVDVMADNLATLYNTGPVNEQGSTESEMYAYLTGATINNARVLHFWVIPTDNASIKRCIEAGYPVLVTANEQNIKSTRTGKQPPYEWNLNANHVIPLMGIDSSGNWIVPDYLNDYSGTGDTFPAHYDATTLQPSWACCVQVVGTDVNNPWLAPIPSGTPLEWDSMYVQPFNAQLFAGAKNTLKTNVTLSTQQAIQYAEQAGFKVGRGLFDIVAIATAESELQTMPKDNINSNGSRDRGILQFNTEYHPEVDDACAYDPLCSFQHAYQVSKSGTDFTQWSTYNNGAYLPHIAQVVQSAIAAVYNQALAKWNSSTAKAPSGTGIFGKYLEYYMSEEWGIPVNQEVQTTDWNGQNIVVQNFSGGIEIQVNGSQYRKYINMQGEQI